MGYYNRNLERWPEWNNFAVLNLVLNMKFAEHFTGHIGIEGYSYHNTVSLDNALMPQFKERLNTALYPHQIEGKYSFGDPAVFKGEIGVGLMPYKYNRDAWSLGEYLFRSGTYPGYLITDFDWAVARLTGFRVSTVAFGGLKNDLLFTVNMEYPPFRDGNLSWIGSYTYRNMVDIGAGVSFCSILSADERLTTPSNLENFQRSDTTIDPVYGTPIITDHYYTFRGTKLMGRLALDLLFFLKEAPLFSFNGIPFGFTRDDGRLYAEVAVLGVENQKPLYGDIKERMPVMFGFNFPTFGLFDALSLQAEYYGYPYANDYGGTYSHAQPGYAAPFDVSLGSLNSKDSTLFANDNWKWSIRISTPPPKAI